MVDIYDYIYVTDPLLKYDVFGIGIMWFVTSLSDSDIEGTLLVRTIQYNFVLVYTQ